MFRRPYRALSDLKYQFNINFHFIYSLINLVLSPILNPGVLRSARTNFRLKRRSHREETSRYLGLEDFNDIFFIFDECEAVSI